MRVEALAMAAMVLAGGLTAHHGDQSVMVGGAAMHRSKNIIENAVNSKDHTTLVTAVKAAGLVDTLQGPGPFTVFAPTNAAFAQLPSGTVEMLLKEGNRNKLRSLLMYHVVPGNLDSTALLAKVKAGGGRTTLATAGGGTLWIAMDGARLSLRDERGATAAISIPDVRQSNGVIHVITSVVMPK